MRGFEEMVVPFKRHVTVIIGENAGKTTVAEGLTSQSFGEDEGVKGFPFLHDGRSGHIVLFEEGAKAPAAQWSAALSANVSETPVCSESSRGLMRAPRPRPALRRRPALRAGAARRGLVAVVVRQRSQKAKSGDFAEANR